MNMKKFKNRMLENLYNFLEFSGKMEMKRLGYFDNE